MVIILAYPPMIQYIPMRESAKPSEQSPIEQFQQELGWAYRPDDMKSRMEELHIPLEQAHSFVIDKIGHILSHSNGYFEDIRRVREWADTFAISKARFQHPDAQKTAARALIQFLNNFPQKELYDNDIGHFQKTIEMFQDLFSIPNETLEKIIEKSAKEKIIEFAQRGRFHNCYFIPHVYGLDDPDFLKTPEITAAAKVGLKLLIEKASNINEVSVDMIKKRFAVPDHDINSQEIQQPLKARIIKDLGTHYYRSALKPEQFCLSEATILEPDLQQAIKERIKRDLREHGGASDTVALVKIYRISESETHKIAKEALMDLWERGEFGRDIYIEKQFAFPVAELRKEPESLAVAEKGIMASLKHGNPFFSHTLKEFELPGNLLQRTEMQQAAEQGIIHRLKHGFFEANYVKAFKEEVKVSETAFHSPAAQQAAQEGIIKSVGEGHPKWGLEIAKIAQLSDDALTKPEVQKVAQDFILRELKGNRAVYQIENCIEVCKLPDSFILNAEIQDLATKAVTRTYVDDKKKLYRLFKIPEPPPKPHPKPRAKKTTKKKKS